LNLKRHNRHLSDKFLFDHHNLQTLKLFALPVRHQYIMDDAVTFELAPAQHEDTPRLADIYAWALLLDPTFGFSYASEAECKMRMIVILEGRIGDPTWQHIKVVDKSKGMPTAWAGWNTPNDAQIREYDESAAARFRNFEEATSEDDFDSLPGPPPSIQETTDR